MLDKLSGAFATESLGVEQTAVGTDESLATGTRRSEEKVLVLSVRHERVAHHVSVFVEDDTTSERDAVAVTVIPFRPAAKDAVKLATFFGRLWFLILVGFRNWIGDFFLVFDRLLLDTLHGNQ